MDNSKFTITNPVMTLVYIKKFPCMHFFFSFSKISAPNIINLFMFLFFYSGKVPVLIDDGFTIYESRPIARYLVNKYQGTKNSTVLIPSDVQKAALVDQFISV